MLCENLEVAPIGFWELLAVALEHCSLSKGLRSWIMDLSSKYDPINKQPLWS